MRRLLRPGLVVVLVVACAGATALAAGFDARGGGSLLPDLAAGAPTQFQIRTERKSGTTRYLLSFESRMENVGDGELLIEASREERRDKTMTADQVVQLADGGSRRVAAVGSLRYVIDPTHQHWHLDDAMAYELVPVGAPGVPRRPDEKTGFCLGDRYEVASFSSPAEPVDKRYDVNCGYDSPGLLRVVEGISVGWGDNYEPWRDGQQIDVSGLPAGRYLLVERVNPKRRLVEQRFGNNASSALLVLTWPDGARSAPDVRPVRICRGSPRCGAR